MSLPILLQPDQTVAQRFFGIGCETFQRSSQEIVERNLLGNDNAGKVIPGSLICFMEDNIVSDIMGQHSHPIFCSIGKLLCVALSRSFHFEDMSGLITPAAQNFSQQDPYILSRYREGSTIIEMFP